MFFSYLVRLIGWFAVLLALPLSALAHEVYVLTPEQVAHALLQPAHSSLTVMMMNFSQFMLWGFIAAVVFSTVFMISISRRIEVWCEPVIRKAKKFAPHVLRAGVGSSLLFGVYHGAFLGPELPLVAHLELFATPISVALAIAGVCILLNRALPLAAMVLCAAFTLVFFRAGWYMLTYVDFLGAALFLFLEGMQDKRMHAIMQPFRAFAHRLYPYRYTILRVAFGLSVITASVFAKFVHNSLALAVVNVYDLTSLTIFSSFSPEFLVLGAGIIEFIAGLMLVLGIEIRHTSLFLAFWLTLSLLYFEEAVWPHAILFGLGGTFLLYGYDKYSLEGYFFKKGMREPIL